MRREIDTEGVRRLRAAGALLIDVLDREEFERSHLPDAINISLDALTTDAVADLERARPVVVYCYDYQ